MAGDAKRYPNAFLDRYNCALAFTVYSLPAFRTISGSSSLGRCRRENASPCWSAMPPSMRRTEPTLNLRGFEHPRQGHREATIPEASLCPSASLRPATPQHSWFWAMLSSEPVAGSRASDTQWPAATGGRHPARSWRERDGILRRAAPSRLRTIPIVDEFATEAGLSAGSRQPGVFRVSNATSPDTEEPCR
jgi:hypothetical protein